MLVVDGLQPEILYRIKLINWLKVVIRQRIGIVQYL